MPSGAAAVVRKTTGKLCATNPLRARTTATVAGRPLGRKPCGRVLQSTDDGVKRRSAALSRGRRPVPVLQTVATSGCLENSAETRVAVIFLEPFREVAASDGTIFNGPT
jgi:hypothetical protein